MYEYNCPACTNPMELEHDIELCYEARLVGICKHCGLYVDILLEDWVQERKEQDYPDWEKIKGEK